MSHPSSRLLHLPPEIVENVIKRIGNRSDLSNARLTCKTLDEHAAKELFKDAISQDDVIRLMPRHAIIHTQPNIEGTSPDAMVEINEEFEAFEGALAAVSRFPNLVSVEIGFTPDCCEDVQHREHLLELIFQAIKDRTANKKNSTIRKLTIVSLQNCSLPDFTSSDLFRDVMGQLEELHISMLQECDTNHDYTKIELQTFPAYFCSEWLEPVSAHLRGLSIYSAMKNWGPFPSYFDPSGISFPKLETLALGHYTLAHDNDLDWILVIKSLRKLILHNCMIASRIRICPKCMVEWKVKTHDWTALSNVNNDGRRIRDFAYNGSWSQSFDHIAGGLPNLVDFRFDHTSPYGYEDVPKYGVNHRDTSGGRIFPQRYICLDEEIFKMYWAEAEDDGSMYSWVSDGVFVNKHAENLDADQKSLERLLGKLRK